LSGRFVPLINWGFCRGGLFFNLPFVIGCFKTCRHERGDRFVTIADVPAAVLAGGLATRLRPITHTLPKAMVEVAGRPFIDHQLALLARHGVRRVVLCLGYLGEQVERHVGDGGRFGLGVAYSHDGDRLLGTGGALRRALPLLGETFWVLYGDSYMDIDYRAVLDHFLGRDLLGLMTVLRNADQWDRSNAVFRDGRLLCYDKRCKSPDMTHIDYGVSLLRKSAVERLPVEQPADLAELYHSLVSEGTMDGYEVTERFYEIGSPQGLAETDRYLRSLGNRQASGAA
jgi:NDP-sugar pyrophosphorylase family protein